MVTTLLQSPYRYALALNVPNFMFVYRNLDAILSSSAKQWVIF